MLLTVLDGKLEFNQRSEFRTRHQSECRIFESIHLRISFAFLKMPDSDGGVFWILIPDFDYNSLY